MTFEKLQLLNTNGSTTNTKSFETDKFKADKGKESINHSLVCSPLINEILSLTQGQSFLILTFKWIQLAYNVQ